MWEHNTHPPISLILTCPNSKRLCVARVTAFLSTQMKGWEPRPCFLEWSRTPENHPLSSQVLFPPWSKYLKSYFARQFLTGNVLCLFSFHFVLFPWGFYFTWVIGPSTPLCEEYTTNTFSCRQKSQTHLWMQTLPPSPAPPSSAYDPNGVAILQWKTLSKQSIGPGRLAQIE